ncbi:hypothetical protein H5410_020945 [Solanum commersonii]|uniref:Uncharacterized protein n=1 Tax=Solanum commersonii TaxID=4109 RepID=A0A9J5ZCS8_SOLCO|nr:hypothetical protein H5410_020945 [Solanum commersonii]
MLQGPNLPILQDPVPNQPQSSERMIKLPRLMRPLARSTSSEEIVWEFYASYAATLRGSISKRSKPLAQDPLTFTIVRDGTSCGVALYRGMLSSERLLYYGWLSTLLHMAMVRNGDSGMSIWHCDRLIHPRGTLDIALIRDEANVAAPHREPQIEVSTLGADLSDMVSQAQAMTLEYQITPISSRPSLLMQLVWLLAHPGPYHILGLLLSRWPECIN